MQQNRFNGSGTDLWEKISDGLYRWPGDLLAHFSHSPYVRFREHGARIANAASLLRNGLRASATVFGHHVHRIVFLRSKEEMVGVHAAKRASVAMMEHVQTIWNFSPGQEVGESVCAINSSVEPEVSVPVLPPAAGPNPARAKVRHVPWYWAVLVDLCEEHLPLGFFASPYSHKRKTPVVSEVKCAGESANKDNGRKLDFVHRLPLQGMGVV